MCLLGSYLLPIYPLCMGCWSLFILIATRYLFLVLLNLRLRGQIYLVKLIRKLAFGSRVKIRLIKGRRKEIDLSAVNWRGISNLLDQLLVPK